jgi:hypothetical protein
MLDLNILSFRKPDRITPFPTLIQTGTESFHLVKSASLGSPRVLIYSEGSANAQDLLFFPYALASDVLYRYTADGYTVTSPYSFVIKLPAEVKAIGLDGVPMSPMRENLFLIPAGNHRINTNVTQTASFSTHELETRIMSMVGNLISLSYGARSATFEYESDTRALVSVNREPTSIFVDGKDYAFTSLKGNDCYSVLLPAGRHTVELTGGDVFSYGVNVTSLWSSTAIAFFAASAVALLVLMYIVLRIVRVRAAR